MYSQAIDTLGKGFLRGGTGIGACANYISCRIYHGITKCVRLNQVSNITGQQHTQHTRHIANLTTTLIRAGEIWELPWGAGAAVDRAKNAANTAATAGAWKWSCMINVGGGFEK